MSVYSNRRRDFLRMLSVCAGGGFLKITSAFPFATNEALADDSIFWENVERLFSENHGVISMDVDVLHRRPIATLNILQQKDREFSEEEFSVMDNQRRKIAKLLNINAKNLALTRGTSDSIRKILFGLSWKEGDVIITTNHEHPVVIHSLALLRKFYSTEVVVIDVPAKHSLTKYDIINKFEETIDLLSAKNKSVRLMLWSSPSYKTGAMFPVHDLVAIAEKNDIITVCDGAHCFGMIDFDFSKNRPDFFFGSGHKWQCASYASGIMILGNRIMRGEVAISTPAVDEYLKKYSKNYEFHEQIASRLSFNSPESSIKMDALLQSCEVWDNIGRKKIEDYIKSLSAYAKSVIINQWGRENIYSPLQDDVSSGLIAFNPFINYNDVFDREKSDRLVDIAIKKYNIHLKNVPITTPEGRDFWPVRISTHIWSSGSQIDTAMDAIHHISTDM